MVKNIILFLQSLLIIVGGFFIAHSHFDIFGLDLKIDKSIEERVSDGGIIENDPLTEETSKFEETGVEVASRYEAIEDFNICRIERVEDCIREQWDRGQEAQCGDLLTEGSRKACRDREIKRKALAALDSSLCNSLEAGAKANCVQEIIQTQAENSQDISLCKKISDERGKERCFSRVAFGLVSETGDESYCKFLTEEGEQEICLEEAKLHKSRLEGEEL